MRRLSLCTTYEIRKLSDVSKNCLCFIYTIVVSRQIIANSNCWMNCSTIKDLSILSDLKRSGL